MKNSQIKPDLHQWLFLVQKPFRISMDAVFIMQQIKPVFSIYVKHFRRSRPFVRERRFMNDPFFQENTCVYSSRFAQDTLRKPAFIRFWSSRHEKELSQSSPHSAYLSQSN